MNNSVALFSNSSKQSHLSNRLQKRMYSVDGASFQEWALARLDYKGSQAHRAIGGLVTAVNRREMSIAQAQAAYTALLSK